MAPPPLTLRRLLEVCRGLLVLLSCWWARPVLLLVRLLLVRLLLLLLLLGRWACPGGWGWGRGVLLLLLGWGLGLRCRGVAALLVTLLVALLVALCRLSWGIHSTNLIEPAAKKPLMILKQASL